MSKFLVGVLTISDRVSRGEAEDKSGPKIKELLKKQAQYSDVILSGLVSDEKDEIKKILIDWSDNKNLQLIITTGLSPFSIPFYNHRRDWFCPSRYHTRSNKRGHT
jgi:molybdopterin biosynthesis enzyme MoaB